MRPMQKVLPHELQQPTHNGKAEPRLWLDLCPLLSGARRGGRLAQARSSLDPRGAKAQVQRASPQGTREAAQGPRAGREGGEHGDQALQDVAVPIFWVCLFFCGCCCCGGAEQRVGSTPSPKIRSVSGWLNGLMPSSACCSIRGPPDPDDLIFPRAATRVGPKYQVGALPVPGEDPPGACDLGHGLPQ